MKVLIDVQSLLSSRTGIGFVVQELIRYLDSCSEIEEIGGFVSVFPFGGRWGSAKKTIQSQNFSSKIHVNRIPLPLGVLLNLWNRFSSPSIETLFDGYDIVHGPSHILPARRNLPSILTVHDTSLLDNPEWYPPSASILRAQLAKGIQNADRMIVPSHFVKNSLVSRYRSTPESIDVIYNPFHGDFLRLSIEEKTQLRKAICGTSEPYLLWIGEINPRKNVGVFPSILSTLRKNPHSSIRLVMIGSPGYQAETFYQEARAHHLTVVSLPDFLAGNRGDILMTGYLKNEEQKKQWLAAAECLIFSSLDEGFGYPILEAMASGIPVIYPKAGALPEIAGDAGVCVSTPHSIQEYVSAVLDLTQNPSFYLQQVEKGLKRKEYFENLDLYPLLEAYKKTIRGRQSNR